MAGRINPRRIKIHRNYDAAEAALALGVHRNTVRNWIKSGDLPALTEKRPHLIRGIELRSFLERRRDARRSPCPVNHIYCLGCRRPRRPAKGIASFERGAALRAGKVSAVCQRCGSRLSRWCNAADIRAIFPGIHVKGMPAR